jgi:hypothetical protein
MNTGRGSVPFSNQVILQRFLGCSINYYLPV